ncbi:AbgT family transporter [Aurantiacibacter gangjinensis]|uniref:Membrane protein n=1 Tax=Aurantiacibacter gangjinensis TaxID=502682 RepID=A0A0G9MRK8_9SPHN|nr:AbgT family transporter [Aurantiacibacter gangjinensis]APE26917.1 Aminobenzoyl-glutamate transport protein [Aurantiacibacter gangjinensis]KLE33376.1 membrane protein [Aurantiacibacter gangjinensis]
MAAGSAPAATQSGFLGWIERTGNRLPDPVLLFVYFIAVLIALSVVASLAGWSAAHPAEIDPDTGTFRIVTVESLLSEANLRQLFTSVPETFTHFAPLGMVLTVMLGAGVAERSGLFTAAMQASVARASRFWLTPSVALACMMANHAADAAFVVMIPLAGIIYHAAGRHPLVGIGVAFASVSGAFSANLLPGQLDALLLGITEEAVQTVFGAYTVNIAGNWYFIAAMTLAYLPVIWFVTDRVVEPRLGRYDAATASAAADDDDVGKPLSPGEKRGLRNAGLVALALVALWAFLVLGPIQPLVDPDAPPAGRLTPFYQSLLPFFLLIFLLPGYAFGRAAGTIGGHRDLIAMMSEAMKDMAYYLVLTFVAAHFVAMFAWSNMGIVLAVDGADALKASGLPMWAMLVAIVLFGAALNLLVGSASAKWAVMAPVLVPMLMLVGVSPEMTTAAYRVGDSATNIITPLMVYFPLVLIFCQRWVKEFGLGSLTALMMPYFFGIMTAGLAITITWVVFDLPLGPGVNVFLDALPAAAQS